MTGQPKRNLAQLLLTTAWAVALVVPISSMMAGHLLTLPSPDKAAVAPRLEGRAASAEGWRAFHVLSPACKCSRQVLAHLLERGAHAGVTETLLFVGEETQGLAQARAAGFRTEALSAQELFDRYKIQTVPLLVVMNPEGSILYSGGYTERKQGADIQDVALLEGAMAGLPAQELPLFGCAVSRELQKQIDPFGLKYAANGARP
jgi:hypothetical protein